MILNKIDFNKKAIIKQVKLHGIKKRRLYDLGFIPGEVIIKKFESIFKNPICYKIKNTLIAVRNEDACNIEVEYE
ncbi:MAG: ferrous iron transport protein A [Bacilli bacterium]|nr:ferrous iron transport protein A [Bacilli bacterium]